MSKQLSAYMVKRTAKGLADYREALPHAGSKLREVYDILLADKGRYVELPGGSAKNKVEYLKTAYGLDIRHKLSGLGPTRHCKYILAGEWIGKIYVDYIAERLDKEKDEPK